MALPKYQKAIASPKAEPKKRGRKPTPSPARAAIVPKNMDNMERPSRKRGKVVSAAAAQIAAANVAAAKQAGIAQALKEAKCVPPSVCDMLCATLHSSCCTTSEFHPFQERVLRMLKETLNDIRAEKTRTALKAASITTRVKEELSRFEQAHTNAEAAVNASTADVQEKTATLAQSVSAMQPFKLMLEKAQTELQSGDAIIGAAAMEIEQLRAVRAQMHDASEEKTLAMLQQLSSGWTLPSEKIENLTLLEGEICQRLAMLSETISKGAVARVACAAEVKIAQIKFDAANEKQQACSADLARAQSERHVHVAVLKAKAQTLKQHRSVVAQTVKAWNTAQQQLEEFQTGPNAAFKSIIHEIQQHYGICISFTDQSSPVKEEAASQTSDLKVPIELSEDKNAVPVQHVHVGTPVIDRKQRQAILRRRSAVLPVYCFNRLSLVARRSSVGPRRRLSMETTTAEDAFGQTAFPKNGGSDSDGEDVHNQDRGSMGKSQPEQVCPVASGALNVPTPLRRSF